MAKTKMELVERALGILQVKQAGQPISAEDAETVKAMVDPLVAYLAFTQVIYIPNSDEIDDAMFEQLAARLALDAAPDFGLPAVGDDVKLAAEIPLRRIASAMAVVGPVTAQYF
jgi:hypothetical protein